MNKLCLEFKNNTIRKMKVPRKYIVAGAELCNRWTAVKRVTTYHLKAVRLRLKILGLNTQLL